MFLGIIVNEPEIIKFSSDWRHQSLITALNCHITVHYNNKEENGKRESQKHYVHLVQFCISNISLIDVFENQKSIHKWRYSLVLTRNTFGFEAILNLDTLIRSFIDQYISLNKTSRKIPIQTMTNLFRINMKFTICCSSLVPIVFFSVSKSWELKPW